MEFLDDKDPMSDIKNRLQTRIKQLNVLIEYNDDICVMGLMQIMPDEVKFLNNLLDLIERS